MGELAKWADENNPFLKLEFDQEVEVEFKDAKIIPNKFDPEKEVVRYTFLVNGNTKYWENGSTKVAGVFDGVAKGTKVKILRESTTDGKGKYSVRV